MSVCLSVCLFVKLLYHQHPINPNTSVYILLILTVIRRYPERHIFITRRILTIRLHTKHTSLQDNPENNRQATRPSQSVPHHAHLELHHHIRTISSVSKLENEPRIRTRCHIDCKTKPRRVTQIPVNQTSTTAEHPGCQTKPLPVDQDQYQMPIQSDQSHLTKKHTFEIFLKYFLNFMYAHCCCISICLCLHF